MARSRSRGLTSALAVPLLLGLMARPLHADEPLVLPPLKVSCPAPALTLEAAVAEALQNNPQLAAVRQTRGIAAAGVVIARTFPYNPFTEGTYRAASGPAEAGITNRVLVEQKLFFTLELCNQGTYRRLAADAHLSKVEWEIAAQEAALAVKTARAFQTVLYRRAKLALAEESVKVSEQASSLIEKLREQGKLSPADLIQIRTEIVESRTQLGPFRLALDAARGELAKNLGRLDVNDALQGNLDYPELALAPAVLTASALELRPDLRALKAAVAEAESMYGLTRADRFGNPVVGPAYELNETNVSFVGILYSMPLAVFNR